MRNCPKKDEKRNKRKKKRKEKGKNGINMSQIVLFICTIKVL